MLVKDNSAAAVWMGNLLVNAPTACNSAPWLLKSSLASASCLQVLIYIFLEVEKKMEVTSPLCYSDLRFNNALQWITTLAKPSASHAKQSHHFLRQSPGHPCALVELLTRTFAMWVFSSLPPYENPDQRYKGSIVMDQDQSLKSSGSIFWLHLSQGGVGVE